MTAAERAALAGALQTRRPDVYPSWQPLNDHALADAEAVLAALAADGWHLTDTDTDTTEKERRPWQAKP